MLDLWGDARGTRSAIGVAELPFDIPVEVKAMVTEGENDIETTAPDLFARYFDDIEVGDSVHEEGTTITS